jgi:predicted ribosomally synthesized peptide with SipW-like signal peptide
VLAVLAGGLALGLGSTSTLAAWTDSEIGQGSFTTSVFDTQSSTDGVSYTDNNGGGATLAFPATGMSPSTTRYATFFVRTKPGSSSGSMTLSGATYTPPGSDEATVLGAALRYRVVSTTGTCAAAAFTGSPVWVVGPTAQTLSTPGSVAVALAGATASTPGTPSGLCFEVSLPSSAATTLQGASSTAVWQIVATSS